MIIDERTNERTKERTNKRINRQLQWNQIVSYRSTKNQLHWLNNFIIHFPFHHCHFHAFPREQLERWRVNCFFSFVFLFALTPSTHLWQNKNHFYFHSFLFFSPFHFLFALTFNFFHAASTQFLSVSSYLRHLHRFFYLSANLQFTTLTRSTITLCAPLPNPLIALYLQIQHCQPVFYINKYRMKGRKRKGERTNER